MSRCFHSGRRETLALCWRHCLFLQACVLGLSVLPRVDREDNTCPVHASCSILFSLLVLLFPHLLHLLLHLPVTKMKRKKKADCTLHNSPFLFPSSPVLLFLSLTRIESRVLLPFLHFSSPPLILISQKNRKTVPIFLPPLLILTPPPRLLFIFLSLTRIETDSSSLSSSSSSLRSSLIPR